MSPFDHSTSQGTTSGTTAARPGEVSRDRYDELLADEALGMLEDADAAELLRLKAVYGADDSLMRPASLVQASMAASASREIPSVLRERILRSAPTSGVTRSGPTSTTAPASRVTQVVAATGWLAAAAAITVAVFLRQPPMRFPGPTLAQERDALVKRAPDASPLEWKSTDAYASVRGDVVWSDAEQRGYMRFVGLPANDPTREQYQLWIFDKNRPDVHPIDGGVFDASSDGELLVPIDAKIKVDDAAMFAITVERPGGVVVSDRSKVVALAGG